VAVAHAPSIAKDPNLSASAAERNAGERRWRASLLPVTRIFERLSSGYRDPGPHTCGATTNLLAISGRTGGHVHDRSVRLVPCAVRVGQGDQSKSEA
jgi:hypothetical protein